MSHKPIHTSHARHKRTTRQNPAPSLRHRAIYQRRPHRHRLPTTPTHHRPTRHRTRSTLHSYDILGQSQSHTTSRSTHATRRDALAPRHIYIKPRIHTKLPNSEKRLRIPHPQPPNLHHPLPQHQPSPDTSQQPHPRDNVQRSQHPRNHHHHSHLALPRTTRHARTECLQTNMHVPTLDDTPKQSRSRTMENTRPSPTIRRNGHTRMPAHLPPAQKQRSHMAQLPRTHPTVSYMGSHRPPQIRHRTHDDSRQLNN